MAAEFEEDMENDVSSLFGDDESEEASSHTKQTSLDQEEASSLFGDELKEATEEPPLSEEENESLEREVMAREIESELERDLEDSPEQLEDDHTDQDDEDLSDDCASSSGAATNYPEQAIQESSDVEERLRSNLVASQRLVEVPIILSSKKSSERERTEVQSSGTEKLMDEEELMDFAAEIEGYFENDQPSLAGNSERASGEIEQTPSSQDELINLFGDDASQQASIHVEETLQRQEELSSLFSRDDPGETSQESCIDEELLQSMAMELERELERGLDDASEEELAGDAIDDNDGHALHDDESIISEEE
ncbi:hypothetical protein E8E14_000277 [Neopestalotiopsis sp. 37M]|nr:hypothetical protein E8E14_000277 [Neopestalotiopsis sp. 37M]